MTTMLIAQNETRESGSFMGDQCCSLKAAYLFVENQPDVDRVIMSVSPGNEMHFLWEKFIKKYDIELVYDDWNPGDWRSRFEAWNKWRKERSIDGRPFDHYRELYLRIHGAQRQTLICGSERGLGRRNIYEYWLAGQENIPDVFVGADWFDDTLVDHPARTTERDVYISPHCKTQGNVTFTFDFWASVVRKLLDAGVTVTVGYDGGFWDHEFCRHPLYKKHWGDHKQWMQEVCRHKLVSSGNTGTGWLASACGVPMITMEPPNSQMPDHRYRECGLRNIVEVVDVPDADYVARRIVEEVRCVVVMTTGCYDVLHAGHVRHLERSKALGTRLIVAMNSDVSVRALKGASRPINPQGQRKTVLEALRCVDEVRIFDGPDARSLIAEIKPDVLTCGFGYTPDDIVGRDLVEEWGGKAVVTCFGDAANEPSTTKIVQAARRTMHAGMIHTICSGAAPHSVNPLDKLVLVANEFAKVAHLPGDVADLGAYRGGVSLILRRIAPDKHLHLFDTWAGTPYDDPLCHHKKGEWAASLEECKILVGENELTHYHQGVFPVWDGDDRRDDHYRPAGEHQFCFVYVDMDTYQATYDAIMLFWSRIVSGGKMVIDDYGWDACAGVKKAVDEVFNEARRRVVQSQYTCILEKQ